MNVIYKDVDGQTVGGYTIKTAEDYFAMIGRIVNSFNYMVTFTYLKYYSDMFDNWDDFANHLIYLNGEAKLFTYCPVTEHGRLEECASVSGYLVKEVRLSKVSNI